MYELFGIPMMYVLGLVFVCFDLLVGGYGLNRLPFGLRDSLLFSELWWVLRKVVYIILCVLSVGII